MLGALTERLFCKRMSLLCSLRTLSSRRVTKQTVSGRLDGKVAIVTGAGSVGASWGNEKAVAIFFAREGAQFVIDGGMTCKFGSRLKATPFSSRLLAWNLDAIYVREGHRHPFRIWTKKEV